MRYLVHAQSTPSVSILTTPLALAAKLTDPRTVLLHTGLKPDRPELAGRAIPGARYADLSRDFRDPTDELPNTFPTPEQFTAAARRLGINADSRVVVCDNVGNYASPRLWFLFRAMGHPEVHILDGGLPAWAAAGQPTAALDRTATYAAGSFRAELQPRWVTDLRAVESALASGDCTVVDARSAGRFSGTEPEPRAGLPSGHLPGSVSLPFFAVLREDGRFRPVGELRRLFQSIAPAPRPLVCSCGSGITASILLVASRIAHPERPVSVFDGSWTEYAQRRILGAP